MGGPMPLYDLSCVGMRLFTRRAFEVHVLGREHLALRPRTLIVLTHRSDHDVPVFAGELYFHEVLRRRGLLPHYAVRDDLFLRGFFAGYPRWRRGLARRLAWPIRVGPIIRRGRCLPIRSAKELRLVEVFGAAPAVPVEELAPPDAVAALAARGIDPARPARDALTGAVADVLWRSYGPGALDRPVHEPMWAERRRTAAADFRTLVDTLAGGGTLALFPEGRPSPDGTIGPLRRGLAAVVRRAKPDLLLPVALAYDPLVPGKTRVHVVVGAPAPPPLGDAEAGVLVALQRAMPLTVGQIAARTLLEETTASAEDDVSAALAEGRPVESDLLDPEVRRQRLREALAAAADEETLRRLAREYTSARETDLVAAR